MISLQRPAKTSKVATAFMDIMLKLINADGPLLATPFIIFVCAVVRVLSPKDLGKVFALYVHYRNINDECDSAIEDRLIKIIHLAVGKKYV